MRPRVAILLTDTSVVAASLQRVRRTWTVIKQARVTCNTPRSLNENSVTTVADSIIEAVRAVDGLNADATLVIPTGWCYTHAIDASRRRINARAAAYELEEFLPLPLDDVTCAFAHCDTRRALGIAVPTRPMRTLLDRLSETEVHVERIVPDILCITPSGSSGLCPDGATVGSSGAMIRNASSCTIGIQRDGAAAPELIRTIRSPVGVDARSTQIVATENCVGVETKVWHIADTHTDVGCETILRHAVEDHAVPILAIGSLARHERRNGTMTALTRTAAVFAFFLLSLAIHWHGQRSQLTSALNQTQARIEKVYQTALPGSPLPPSPAMRLASERVRLERLTRRAPQQTTNLEPDDRLAALTLLRRIAELVPDDVRINVLEMAVDRHQLTLRGQTRDHRDAERIAESIGRIDTWSAKPPRTSRLQTGGVEFTIRATHTSGSPTTETVAYAK